MSSLQIGSADWNLWPISRDYSTIFSSLRDLGVLHTELGIYRPSRELSQEKLEQILKVAASNEIVITAMLFSLIDQEWPKGAFADRSSNFIQEVEIFLESLERGGITHGNIWTGVDLDSHDTHAISETLRELDDLAAKFNGKVSIEYKDGTVFRDCATLLGYLEDFAHINVLLDTGHAYALGENPLFLIDQLQSAGRLGAIHLGDAVLGDSDADLPLGRVHDFAEFLSRLQEINEPIIANFDLYGAAVDEMGPGPNQVIQESIRHIYASGFSV